MGLSPLHNHVILLVLNRNSDLVSPQFHVRYELLFTTTKDFVYHYCAALSNHPSPQEGGKSDILDPFSLVCHSQPEGDSGCHSQQEGYPDAHFSPQEGASSDENTSQPGGAYQPDAHFYQQEGASNDGIPSQQEGPHPKPIILISDQEG